MKSTSPFGVVMRVGLAFVQYSDDESNPGEPTQEELAAEMDFAGGGSG